MRLLWSRVLAGAQVLGGIGLIGWAVLLYGLAGWGTSFSDFQWNVTAILPWLAPLAIGPVLMARRSAEGRRRLARIGTACVAATLVVVLLAVIDYVQHDPCPPTEAAAGDKVDDPCLQLPPWPLLLLLVPLTTAALFLGFVTLAIPALAARTRIGRAVGLVPFALGFVIMAYPEQLVAQDHLREWLFATLAMLVSLGVALTAVGIEALRARDG